MTCDRCGKGLTGRQRIGCSKRCQATEWKRQARLRRPAVFCACGTLVAFPQQRHCSTRCRKRATHLRNYVPRGRYWRMTDAKVAEAKSRFPILSRDLATLASEYPPYVERFTRRLERLPCA